jgi:hypothetical protein
MWPRPLSAAKTNPFGGQSHRIPACPRALAHVADALRRKPFACATRSTASSSPLSPASSAAGHPPKRITFALLNRARSVERSATNTRSPSAGSITGSCTPTAMKLPGGPRSASTRCPSPSSCGDDLARLKSREATTAVINFALHFQAQFAVLVFTESGVPRAKQALLVSPIFREFEGVRGRWSLMVMQLWWKIANLARSSNS